MKKFSLKSTAVPICIENAEGKEEQFEIREMTSAGRESYLNTSLERSTLDDKGNVVGIKNFEGINDALLTRCLYHVRNGTSTLVTKQEVDGWPATVVGEIYKDAQIVNGLNKTAEEKKADAKKA